MRILDRSSLDGADWPGDADGDYARRYLEPFLADGPRAYVANADTTMLVLRVADVALPLTRSDGQPGNSYVCSPYAQYVTYALEELRALRSPGLERLPRIVDQPLRHARAVVGPRANARQPGPADDMHQLERNAMLRRELHPAAHCMLGALGEIRGDQN